MSAADMHRVRHMTNYMHEMGTKVTIAMVHEKYTPYEIDYNLSYTIPADIKIIKVGAVSNKLLKIIGIGSLALRCIWSYFIHINKLLEKEKFDLIFFSTTMFPIPVLGAYWKYKYGVPYVVDIQDMWHSDYYQNKPKHQKPKNYWFSYPLHKFTEPLSLKNCAGIVSVSQAYIDILQSRYTHLNNNNCLLQPFSALDKDFEILQRVKITNKIFDLNAKKTINIVYVGRGGEDMNTSLTYIFKALAMGLKEDEKTFSQIKMYFIGTSYTGSRYKPIEILAQKYSVSRYVSEHPKRYAYFEALNFLTQADMLIVPGSDDPNYTASKIYSYILAQKPILAVFHASSSIPEIINTSKSGEYMTFINKEIDENIVHSLYMKWHNMLKKIPYSPETDYEAFAPYTAQYMTMNIIQFFDRLSTE
ncbi:MAG: glycosyltransferase [Cytophagales bacterium]|nr:glycosyltransferase [Cytophagales bacterium]